MTFRTIRVRAEGSVCYLQLYRPEANNTINPELIDECRAVVASCEESYSVLVIEGLPEVFCFGADFNGIHGDALAARSESSGANELYQLWESLAGGSFIVISHVRGQANAGGVGFVAASDVVLADAFARFSLSEMLFGIYPACVLPFLAKRIGLQRANYLTLSTQPIAVELAFAWGLVDAWHAQSENLLQRHLQRMKRLSKTSIAHYKSYVRQLDTSIALARPLAVKHNYEMHALPGVINGIVRYVETGMFPWE